MKLKSMKRLLLVLVISALVTFGGCQNNAQLTVTPKMQERLQELVQEFVNTIQSEIIPAKDDLDRLRKLGSPVSRQDSSYNIDNLYVFYEEYEQGGDTAINIVFSNTSFVITRIIFEDGQGYYLRHQYDSKASGPLQVTTKLIDSVKLTEYSNVGKVELSLNNNKAQVAVVTFKNVDVDITEKAAG